MSRGINRERQVRVWLEERDYVVIRAAGSFGCIDLCALKDGERPRLIEVKSTIGPYDHFGPKDRAQLAFAAMLSGGSAELAWWPKHGKLRFIDSSEWPPVKSERMAA